MVTFKDSVYLDNVLEDKLSKMVFTSATSLKVSIRRRCLPKTITCPTPQTIQ